MNRRYLTPNGGGTQRPDLPLMFRPARREEYLEWLGGFIAAGGKPTSWLDYPWSDDRLLFAAGDFRLGGERGAAAGRIVVARGVRYLGGGLGHNALYHLDGFRLEGLGWVPVWNDVPFLALPGMAAFVAAQEQEHREWERKLREDREAAEEAARHSDLSAYTGFFERTRGRGRR